MVIPHKGMFPKDYISHPIDAFSFLFIAALFSNTPDIKTVEVQPLMVVKTWNIYTMEYYSVAKRNEIMRFTGKWMDLKTIILSEVTPTQKDKYYMFSFLWEC